MALHILVWSILVTNPVPTRPFTHLCHQELLSNFCYVFLFSVDTSIVDPEEDCVYFCGNSLGLCPKKTKQYMDVEIDKWSKL